MGYGFEEIDKIWLAIVAALPFCDGPIPIGDILAVIIVIILLIVIASLTIQQSKNKKEEKDDSKETESGKEENSKDAADSPTSQNQRQKQVERGQAPKAVDRVDKPHVDGQQPHIHFGENEAALNIDGTWHDAGKNQFRTWIMKQKNG